MEFRSSMARITAVVFAIVGLIIMVGASLQGVTTVNARLVYALAALYSLSAWALYFIPWDRSSRWVFLSATLGGVAMLTGLIYMTGGHKSPFFPMFFLMAVFGGAMYDLVPLTIMLTLINIAHISYLFTAKALDMVFVQGLFAFVPSLYIVGYATYAIVREVRRQVEARENVETLAHQLEKKAEQMSVLFEVAKRAGASLKLDHVLNIIIEDARKFVGSDIAVIRLQDEKTRQLWVAATQGLSDEVARKLPVLKAGQGVAGWVAKNAKSLNVYDVSKESRFVFPLEQENIKSVLAVPMMVGSEVVGVLTCGSYEKRSFTKDDEIFAATLAGEAAIVIENARLYEATEALTMEDALTGLFNQRKLQSGLDDEIRRAGRYKREFSFVMLDIDYFKHYNDTNGHPQGDVALKTIAQILLEHTRDVDTVYRYGGEEMSIILPETSKDVAFELADRLRRLIQEHPFEGEEKQPNKSLTVSIGLATYPIDAISKEGLIKKADQALYRAKKAGRNKVLLA